MERVKSSSLRMSGVWTIDQNSVPLPQKLETDRRLIAADFSPPRKEKKENLVSRYTRIPFSILFLSPPIPGY